MSTPTNPERPRAVSSSEAARITDQVERDARDNARVEAISKVVGIMAAILATRVPSEDGGQNGPDLYTRVGRAELAELAAELYGEARSAVWERLSDWSTE